MTLHWKLTIDAQDPIAQADFWGRALGYGIEDHSSLIQRLREQGHLPEGSTTEAYDREVWRDFAAVRHPDDPVDEKGVGLGRRLLFQRVPESKTTKNRLHLDVHVGPERREEEVARLTALGATVLYRQDQPMGSWTTMADPEGNEFCVE
ncbi:VOC family protein [Streptomyces yaizuensis]|uniref:VOC family protein n=1 Tax=Streptomyces yaizuensis TaxID=2989713 RepID=A0ABQ5P4F8_9ACTN|nr:VOC family protein [Streptomyces sp. YSPA8]GLF97488.1 VOC family protein [Streptomyces sp. YSPA8]